LFFIKAFVYIGNSTAKTMTRMLHIQSRAVNNIWENFRRSILFSSIVAQMKLFWIAQKLRQ